MAKPDIGKLGFWGIIYGDTYADQVRLAQRVEKWGYSAIWVPDTLGSDPFVSLTLMARETSDLYLATGIANIYTRTPVAMAATRASLGTLSQGRLVLGLGVSHPEVVSGALHMDFNKPLATMRDYLDNLKPVQLVGEAEHRTADERRQAWGPVVIAALREKMLKLSSTHADGAHPYLVTPEHTARAREIMGPDSLLAPEQKVLMIEDASEARSVARKFVGGYLGLKNYCNNLRELGFNDSDFENGGSDRLIDALVAWGSADTIYKRLEEHWANGADHVCIQPLRRDGLPGYDSLTVEALAPKG